MNMKRLSTVAAVMLAALVVLSGCGRKQTLGYFVDTAKIEEGMIPLQMSQLKIEPMDELIINVTSVVPQDTWAYNLPFNSYDLSMDIQKNSALQKQTYKVDANGNINFPVLGKLHVAGLTTIELAEDIERRVREDVPDATVKVELVNFRIKVLGEVKNPGSYKSDSERVSVLDALAMSGDMTIYGRRDNVTVIRRDGEKVLYKKLNLNDSDIINSPYFFLKQNDVVYVEPSSSRSGQAEYNQNNSYKVTVISTIMSAISVITSLAISLTRL